jgi:hypothetical protein
MNDTIEREALDWNPQGEKEERKTQTYVAKNCPQ